jgi:hypothetical protein
MDETLITMACHSEGATRSKSKSKKIKVKGDVPKSQGDRRISGSSRLEKSFLT